ncbi:MAG: 50S ribosomal protein L24 [Acidobacteriota bacterium]
MSKIALKKNDLVVVIRGKDKGKQGKVLKLIPETNRVIVERVNFVKHFVKADRSKNQQGGVMEKEAPIAVSNVMLYCAECGQGVRARSRRHEDGSKDRYCHRCDTLIEKAK